MLSRYPSSNSSRFSEVVYANLTLKVMPEVLPPVCHVRLMTQDLFLPETHSMISCPCPFPAAFLFCRSRLNLTPPAAVLSSRNDNLCLFLSPVMSFLPAAVFFSHGSGWLKEIPVSCGSFCVFIEPQKVTGLNESAAGTFMIS